MSKPRSVIKIEPLFATDAAQMRALMRHQNEPLPYESFCAEEAILQSGLMFWQHWLPCRWHFKPSVYIAKEDGVVLALISVSSTGKARACWRIQHLVVHPHQRGRGIAQELLRYVFALFGSQGVSHFIADVSIHNQGALSLLGTCGFRRGARSVYYRIANDKLALHENSGNPSNFRLATLEDKQSLYQLHQDALPPDLRLIYDFVPDDFAVSTISVESKGTLLRKLIREKVWYWVSEDLERKVLTCAIKVTAHREGDYHIEFAIHPGWTHMAGDAVSFLLNTIYELDMKGVILAKAYDYQSPIGEALEQSKLEKEGEFCLMAREHWLRAKKPRRVKLDRTVTIPAIAKPAINMMPRNIFPSEN